MKQLAFVLVLLFAQAGVASAQESEKVKTFDALRCRLVLPNDNYSWFRVSGDRNILAAYRDTSGTAVLFLARKAPAGTRLDASFQRAFDRGVTKEGDLQKISGKFGTFRGVPCYEVHLRETENDSIVTMRVFVANGCYYLLQALDSPLPVEQRSQLEPLFSAFEFTSTPVLPRASSVPDGIPPGSSDLSGKDIAGMVGLLAFIVLLLFLFITLLYRLTRKKNN